MKHGVFPKIHPTCHRQSSQYFTVFISSWGWSGKVPAWAEFQLASIQALEELTIFTGLGWGLTKNHITSFKMTAKREGLWVDLENVWVKNASEAVIKTDGTVTLSQPQDRLDLMFDQVDQVSAIKLTVLDAYGDSNYGTVTELLVPCK